MKHLLSALHHRALLPGCFRPWCLWMMSAILLHGQQKKSTPQIYCVAYAPNVAELFVKERNDRFQRIEVSTANVLELAGVAAEGGSLSLYGPANDAGKHELAATAEIANVAHPLIILQPVADAAAPYAAKVIDADPARFSLGSYFMVNLSPHTVRMTLDQQSVEILPAETHIYQPKAAEGEPLAITIDYKMGEEWQILSRSNWANRKDRRSLVCIVEDPASKRMVIKSIPLRPSAKP
jgi:hypothetical protein